MFIIVCLLTILCIVLILVLIHVSNEANKDQEYDHEALFEAWHREIILTCQKWASFHNKVVPEILTGDVKGIRQVIIQNHDSLLIEPVLLATINFNFHRKLREVSVGYGPIIPLDHIEHWPVDGSKWVVEKLISEEICQYFTDLDIDLELILNLPSRKDTSRYLTASRIN